MEVYSVRRPNHFYEKPTFQPSGRVMLAPRPAESCLVMDHGLEAIELGLELLRWLF